MQDQKPCTGYIKDKDYYFDSYSHFSIHEEMLKDKVRTKTYMNAILNNPQLFKDKLVLDVGSGTAILSIFAAKSGAKHVYGIERANIAVHSREIIKENKLSDKITIIQGLVEEVVLPVEKVDIIISEWMGYFLLYEAMFDSVLYAREKWLAPGGIMLPDRARMFIAALDDAPYYHKKLNFWDNVYGVSMNCIKNWVLSEPVVDPIEHQNILSGFTKIYDINLVSVSVAELQFNSEFKLVVQCDGTIHAFVSWFQALFSHGAKCLILSTSPYKKQTHWKQTVFYLKQPVEVKQGGIFEGEINVEKAKENHRELNVWIEYRYNQGRPCKNYYRIS